MSYINNIKLVNTKNKEFLKTINDIDNISNIDDIKIVFDDTIKIISKDISKTNINYIIDIAKHLKPWRKGPFELFGNKIDSEWVSYKKFNIIKEYFNIKDKIVADIGCNNGYYMFKMLKYQPKQLIGFDPSTLFFLQFYFLNHFIKSDIDYKLFGTDKMQSYNQSFDTILCLGVLYHRQDPIGTLKTLKNILKRGGDMILDTLVIDKRGDFCLFPKKSYQKMSNVFFIPTVTTLINWLLRVGFVDIEVLKLVKTTLNEQRKTSWIDGESLNDFLNKDNNALTIEGYPAPIRAYIKCRRK